MMLSKWSRLQLLVSLSLSIALCAAETKSHALQKYNDAAKHRFSRAAENPGQVLLQVVHTSRKKEATASDCSLCKYGVDFLDGLIDTGFSPHHISELAAEACALGRIEEKEVCNGMTQEYVGQVITILSKTKLSSEQVCAVVLGDSCGQTSGPQFNWSIALSPKPPSTPSVLPPADAPKLRVLQLSDIHFDPLYAPGSPAECKEPLCCRNTSNSKNPSAAGAGRWGDYRDCDTPLWTFEHMLQNINTQTFDYVLWTGDLPPHDVWKQTKDSQVSLLRLLMVYLKKYFPNTPIFPALGNHESAPVDSFPPPFVTDENSIHWLYSELSNEWSRWLPNDTMATMNKGAYYTTLIRPGFRLVSINMNYCNNMNWWLLLNSTDPAQQLQWLVSVLQHAEDKQEKVHIVGHIPPGSNDCLKVWSRNYYNIINRYSNVIMAQFFGHTHHDHFEVVYDRDRQHPSGVMYISPSVTPYSGLNPGYRLYIVDGDREGSTRLVLNHVTYATNLTAANLGGEPVWRREYDALTAYGMSSLLPAAWDELVTRMASNQTLFDYFYDFYHKQAPHGRCVDDCRSSMLCSLRSGRSHDDAFCSKVSRQRRVALC